MGNIDKEISRRGLMLVLSSPSGAGKSTIARNLLRDDPDITLSVSVTTRARRGSEIDGKDYHFISEREFEIMRDNGRLLEWAEVHGNFYGTPFDPVQQAMDEGRDMLFDIDWQGALQMFEAARSKSGQTSDECPTKIGRRRSLENVGKSWRAFENVG